MNDRDYEMIAQQVSGLSESLASVTARLTDVEIVNARLEAAALTTARALDEISRHWHAVYEAMRRAENRNDVGEDQPREP